MRKAQWQRKRLRGKSFLDKKLIKQISIETSSQLPGFVVFAEEKLSPEGSCRLLICLPLLMMLTVTFLSVIKHAWEAFESSARLRRSKSWQLTKQLFKHSHNAFGNSRRLTIFHAHQLTKLNMSKTNKSMKFYSDWLTIIKCRDATNIFVLSSTPKSFSKYSPRSSRPI